jgi:GAF domain-containing protein
MDVNDLNAPQKLRDILLTGTERFGLEFGIVSSIRGDDYVIVAQVSPENTLSDGQRFPYADTYCNITIQKGDVVAISHMSESEYRGHPCYSVFKLQTYIGIPIRRGEDFVGTLNFSSPIPYGRTFTDADRAFIEHLGTLAEAVFAPERTGSYEP